MSRKPGPILRCARSNPTTGEPCKFSTVWGKFNLDRHISRTHKEEKDGFIQYLVTEDGFLRKRAAPPNMTPPAQLSPTMSNVNVDVSQRSGLPAQPQPPISSENHEVSHHISAVASHTAFPAALSANLNGNIAPSLVPSQILPSTHINIFRTTPELLPKISDTIHARDTLSPSAGNGLDVDCVIQRTPAQQIRDRNRKRLNDSLEKKSLPSYSVKRSKSNGVVQHRALDWRTYAGKVAFDRHYASLLSEWGLKRTHKGTCLWLPADWAALEPLSLVEMFIAESCPVSYNTDGVAYAYKDHTTSLTRAVAWFATEYWPRNGAEHDNFLRAGEYKLREGSHLCHHHLCVIHVIFEDPDINEDRKKCHCRAKFLRKEGLPIPHFCAEHNPPCWMQHAALTILEVILIQFSVLLVAKELPPLMPPPRPRWHPYLTFEYQLPLSFCEDSAVKLVPEETIRDVIQKVKPELKCPFCQGIKIKAFKSIIALWSHFVHQHYKPFRYNAWTQTVIPEQDLLKEVVRTADLWLTYWRENSDGGKKRDPTYLRCIQAGQDEFAWPDVLDWNLT